MGNLNNVKVLDGSNTAIHSNSKAFIQAQVANGASA